MSSESPLDVSFRISEEAQPHLKAGLTPDTASRIAGITLRIAGVDAVAITDRTHILAFEGSGCPTMLPGRGIQTEATRRALRTGEIAFLHEKAEIGCAVWGCPCPIQAAVIAPLRVRQDIVGTIKLYSHRPAPVPAHVERLALGISQLLGLQLELAEAERQRELLAEARLDAMRAQIRPHFLFNTLTTIIATSRTNPDLGRELLMELASFLRHTVDDTGEVTTVAEEIAFVGMYLRLEKARLGERLSAELHVDPTVLGAPIPVLTIEPLVENAVMHGIGPLDGPGRLSVAIRRRAGLLRWVVADNGVGMSADRRAEVLVPGAVHTSGIGLTNVNERLIGHYGEGSGLRLRSRPGSGTTVSARIPIAL